MCVCGGVLSSGVAFGFAKAEAPGDLAESIVKVQWCLISTKGIRAETISLCTDILFPLR